MQQTAVRSILPGSEWREFDYKVLYDSEGQTCGLVIRGDVPDWVFTKICRQKCVDYDRDDDDIERGMVSLTDNGLVRSKNGGPDHFYATYLDHRLPPSASKYAEKLREVQQVLEEIHEEIGETHVYPFADAWTAACNVADMAEYLEDSTDDPGTPPR